MGFRIFMLIVVLLIPLIMLLFGWLFFRRTPKKSITYSDTEQKGPWGIKKHGILRINILGKYGIFADYFQHLSPWLPWPLFLKRERRQWVLLALLSRWFRQSLLLARWFQQRLHWRKTLMKTGEGNKRGISITRIKAVNLLYFLIKDHGNYLENLIC